MRQATEDHRSRRNRTLVASLGAGIIGLTAVTAVALWPDGEGSPQPSGSESPSPSASSIGDLPWGEPIPWDEVGPGWTLLAYDAEPEQMEWGEDWSLAGDELWLLGPDGELYFGADVSGLDATYVAAWTGREVWLFKVTDYEGELGIGTEYSVDLTTGDVTVVADNSPAPGDYIPTADEGIYLSRGGCCGCEEIAAHYADGTTRLLNDGCGAASLSPDGTTLAYATDRDDGNGVYRTTFMVTDLEGRSRAVADSSLTNYYQFPTWLDDENLLIYEDDGEGVGVLATLNVNTGIAAPWPGAQPEGFYLDLWIGYPGSWLIWNSYDEPVMTTRVTDRTGAVLIDIGCEYASCWPYATGDLIVWTESDLTYEDGTPVGDDLQRLTLIDPATAQRTFVLEYVREDGHITTILPHPPAYG